MRTPSPDEICGLCVDFTRKDAEPQYAELGMGRCHGYDQDENTPVRYVGWDHTCVLFAKDKANASACRQFVLKQRAKETFK